MPSERLYRNESKGEVRDMSKQTILKVKAFMDSLKSDGFGDLCQPIIDSIPYQYEDEIWEFELVIRKLKRKPHEEDFCGVQVDIKR